MTNRFPARGALWAAGIFSALALMFGWKINGFINSQTSDSLMSESGRYLIENVSVCGIFMAFGDMAYLRITDKETSNSVFRSPLYSERYLDMRSHEDNAVVGIEWIDFHKGYQHFEIRMPEWKEHWLNYFISNTSYEVIGND